MALRHKRATTVALDPETDALLSKAARAEKTSRSDFIRRALGLVLERYRDHPMPRSAGVVKGRLRERGDERELVRNDS
jgi:predicted transcriptional regulator